MKYTLVNLYTKFHASSCSRFKLKALKAQFIHVSVTCKFTVCQKTLLCLFNSVCRALQGKL
jgi:hypothetical protein